MGFFGGQTKPDMKLDSQLVSEQEDQFEEVPALPKPQTNTVIAKDMILTGSLRGEGVVQVEGTVEGEADVKGAVIVAATGLFKGPISADVVRVAGCVEGSVTARDHMRLEKTGNLNGDVTTASLVVEDGGVLNGRSNMIKKEQPPMDTGRPLDSLQFGSNYHAGEEEEKLK